MHTCLAIFLLLLSVSGVSAQEFFVGDDYFGYYVRPFRDRSERFRSARVNALQMRLVVDDESDTLTLENWGDNRADLKSRTSAIKFNANVAREDVYSGASNSEKIGNSGGVHARFDRLEIEAASVHQVTNDGTPPDTKYHKLSAGAAFAFGPENFSFGVHAAGNREGGNTAIGVAAILRKGLYELGATSDFIWYGADNPRTGPALGVQVLLKPFRGLKTALRGSRTTLTMDDAIIGASSYRSYKISRSEFGARMEFRFDAVPVTLGAEYSSYLDDTSYITGSSWKIERDTNLMIVGAAIHLLEERLMFGVEAQKFLSENTYDTGGGVIKVDKEGRTLTGGAELWVLPGFAVRASAQKIDTAAYGNEVDGTTFAAGAGFKGGRFSVDASVRRNAMGFSAGGYKYTDVHVTANLKF